MTDVAYNGRVHVSKTQCKTCIFRPGNLMHLEPGRVESMVADATRNQGQITCHSTLDNKHAGDGTTDARDTILAMWGDRAALVFGTWRVTRPACRELLVWNKTNMGPGMGDLTLPWGPCHEEIYVIGDGFTGRVVGRRIFDDNDVSVRPAQHNARAATGNRDRKHTCRSVSIINSGTPTRSN